MWGSEVNSAPWNPDLDIIHLIWAAPHLSTRYLHPLWMQQFGITSWSEWWTRWKSRRRWVKRRNWKNWREKMMCCSCLSQIGNHCCSSTKTISKPKSCHLWLKINSPVSSPTPWLRRAWSFGSTSGIWCCAASRRHKWRSPALSWLNGCGSTMWLNRWIISSSVNITSTLLSSMTGFWARKLTHSLELTVKHWKLMSWSSNILRLWVCGRSQSRSS